VIWSEGRHSSTMPSTRQSSSRRSSTTQSSRPAPSRLENVRAGINQLFTGRSTVGRVRSQPPESPKAPRLVLGLQNFSSTRLAVPYLNRTATSTPTPPSPTAASPRSAHSPSTPLSSRPITPNALRHHTSRQPSVSTIPPQVRHNSSRRFVGIDPAEVHLAELANVGRQRRKNKPKQSERTCAPKIKNRKIRAKILSCFISGLVNYAQPLTKLAC
jgi:hypothetical protein